MTTPIQDQPESTVGRKPDRSAHPETSGDRPARPAIPREDEEAETGGASRERERDRAGREPSTVGDAEEPDRPREDPAGYAPTRT